ncbi:hypothetical protein BJ741DRAFT_610183 [Chytriomyces cf. hyalinus JEL632]|nr:hypothetical protein BJ741DRAFT_610183 [Chytriomyces cf. hyalinus JEL632]
MWQVYFLWVADGPAVIAAEWELNRTISPPCFRCRFFFAFYKCSCRHWRALLSKHGCPVSTCKILRCVEWRGNKFSTMIPNPNVK